MLGQRVTVTAELLEVDGRKLLFLVEARNLKGRVAEGILRRTIVQLGRLESSPASGGP
jgi:predicted thioesterase